MNEYDEFWKESAASTQPTHLDIHTIEVFHENLVDELLVPTPVYYCLSENPYQFTIEAGAKRNSGQVVQFVPGAFDLTPPKTTADVPKFSINLTIYNVSNDMYSMLKLASISSSPIEIIWRLYTIDLTTSLPVQAAPRLPPPTLNMHVGRLDPATVILQASFGLPLYKDLTESLYTPGEFPTILKA